MSRKQLSSVDVLAAAPVHPSGACLPGFMRIGLFGVMAVDEPANRPPPGVGPERLAGAIRELEKDLK